MERESKGKFWCVTIFVLVGGGSLLCQTTGSRASWTQQASGTQRTLLDVWGASPTDVFAVGDDGVILHYNGNTWYPQQSDTSVRFNAVWGASGRDVFAVGDVGTVIHYDGNTWRRADGDCGSLSNLHAIWGTSRTNVFAVGESGTILHYDGNRWWRQRSKTTHELFGLWGLSPEQVYAAGASGTVLHYDGSWWQPLDQRIPGTYNLLGIWGTSATNLYLVGTRTIYVEMRPKPQETVPTWESRMFHYDGSSWRSVSSMIERLAPITAVKVISPTDVYAIGAGGTIAHFDGISWTTISTPTHANLFGVWATKAGEIFAVGEIGTILRRIP